MTNTVSTNISRQKKITDPRSSRGGAAARAFFYITERSLSTGRIYYRYTKKRLTTGYRWYQSHSVRYWWSHDIWSVYSRPFSAFYTAVREPYCAFTGARGVFLYHIKCLPTCRRTWLFPNTSQVLLVVLVGVFLPMTLCQPTTLGRARSESLTKCSYA